MEAIVIAQSQQPQAADLLGIGLILTVILVIFAISIGINILICALLYTSVGRVPQQYRVIEPGLVWLLLIPLFYLIWNFFVFARIPRSFQNYFQASGDTTAGDCGEGIGRWYAICAVCSLVPCVGSVAGIAALVLLIMFLVKVWDLRSRIGTAAPAAM